MALSITDLKKGTIFQFEGQPYRVTEYGQKVMGRGGSIVNVKIKNLIDGHTLDKTFKGNEVLDSADVQNRSAQFLYTDDKNAYFMDAQSFENHELDKTAVGPALDFMAEGTNVQLLIFNDRAVGIDPPKNVFLKVIHAEDAVKGDTASSITKNAQVETGASIKVPPFIKVGDIISVDTTTGNYRERKKD